MGRTRRPPETGCKADQAADQARTDNGSQETARSTRARPTAALLSPSRVLIVRLFQRFRVMVRRAERTATGAWPRRSGGGRVRLRPWAPVHRPGFGA